MIIPFDLNIFNYNKNDYTKIFINGNWLGFNDSPYKFVEYFKKLKVIVKYIHTILFIGI